MMMFTCSGSMGVKYDVAIDSYDNGDCNKEKVGIDDYE